MRGSDPNFLFKLRDEKKFRRLCEVKPPYKDFRPYEYPDQVWNTREDGTLDVGHANDDVSLTQQQFKDECDINNILQSYAETGTINHINRRPEMYGDFSQLTDLHESMETVRFANESFNALPAKVRARFDNDPRKLVEFCASGSNLEEAIELGLADRPSAPINANDDLTTNAKKGASKGSSKPKGAVSPPVVSNEPEE